MHVRGGCRLERIRNEARTIADERARDAIVPSAFPRRAWQLLKSFQLFTNRMANWGEFMGFALPTGGDGTKRNTASRATPFRKIILARIRLSNCRTSRITPYSTLGSRIIHSATNVPGHVIVSSVSDAARFQLTGHADIFTTPHERGSNRPANQDRPTKHQTLRYRASSTRDRVVGRRPTVSGRNDAQSPEEYVRSAELKQAKTGYGLLNGSRRIQNKGEAALRRLDRRWFVASKEIRAFGERNSREQLTRE